MAANPYAARLSNERGESVIFEATPDIIETRNVNYSTVDPVHMPGQIYTYKNTSSRVYNVSNIRFISRTQGEAQRNLTWLHRLRGWCMPEFGTQGGQQDLSSTIWPEWGSNDAAAENTARQQAGGAEFSRSAILEDQKRATDNFGVNLLGTPPDMLFFSAYSTNGQGGAHISRVPVVIQQLSIPYPSDVDYINTAGGVPMPTIMSLDFTLIETHAPQEFEQFNLGAFKQGLLGGF